MGGLGDLFSLSGGPGVSGGMYCAPKQVWQRMFSPLCSCCGLDWSSHFWSLILISLFGNCNSGYHIMLLPLRKFWQLINIKFNIFIPCNRKYNQSKCKKADRAKVQVTGYTSLCGKRQIWRTMKCQTRNIRLPYLLVYKSTFYDQNISPKNRPRLIHESYTKTWQSSPRN